jgi:hypothetical protein
MTSTPDRTRACKVLLVTAIVAFAIAISSSAWAGPYLNTSTMLLHESSNTGRWIRSNLGDKELARNAHKMAQARLDVASKMNVPTEVREAHPHLLLSLAAMERAMQAAIDGQVSDFIRQIQTSSGEAKTFQSVLQTLGFALPNFNRTSLQDPPERSQARRAMAGAATRAQHDASDVRDVATRSAKAARRGQRSRPARAPNDASRLALLLDLSAP